MNVAYATSPINGECGIVWVNPANGDLTGCPPLLAWIRESAVFAHSRIGPFKTPNSVVVYGWSILAPRSQRNNLSKNVYLRRLFYLRLKDYCSDPPIPFNAVDPKSIAPGVPGTRIGTMNHD